MRFINRIVPFTLAIWLLGPLAATTVRGQSLEELHQKALKEGGTLNFYGTLAQVNAEKILPVFEKKFPGIKINHVDATSDKLVARAVTEARGGKTLGDVLSDSPGKRHCRHMIKGYCSIRPCRKRRSIRRD